MSRLISRMDGITETLHFQDCDDTATLNRVQDVEPIIEANKRAQSNNDGMSTTREWRHIARIPDVVYLEWCKTYGVDVLHPEHSKLLTRLLSDPENRWFRVDGGRI